MFSSSVPVLVTTLTSLNDGPKPRSVSWNEPSPTLGFVTATRIILEHPDKKNIQGKSPTTTLSSSTIIIIIVVVVAIL